MNSFAPPPLMPPQEGPATQLSSGNPIHLANGNSHNLVGQMNSMNLHGPPAVSGSPAAQPKYSSIPPPMTSQEVNNNPFANGDENPQLFGSQPPQPLRPQGEFQPPVSSQQAPHMAAPHHRQPQSPQNPSAGLQSGGQQISQPATPQELELGPPHMPMPPQLAQQTAPVQQTFLPQGPQHLQPGPQQSVAQQPPQHQSGPQQPSQSQQQIFSQQSVQYLPQGPKPPQRPNPQQGPAHPPQRSAQQLQGFAPPQPPQSFAHPPQGYSQPPQSLSQAPSQPPQVFSQPPQGLAQPPQGFSQPQPPQGYAQPPLAYAQPPQGYSQPPQGYSQPPQGMQQPSYPGPPGPYMQQQPGQPPFPQQQPSHGYAPPGGAPGGQFNQVPAQLIAPPAQRKLDPDQMPNPIQVMAENQHTSSGIFVTNLPGLLPPLVTTKYITQDQGNTGPRFLRSSMYNVPATSEMIKQAGVPFSLIVSPFAKTLEGEITPPIVDFGDMGPVRCIRCKGYMSPNMQFIDAGRRFQCLLCKASTEVPQPYFQHLDHTGQRVDKFERPELVLGTYEFVATKDYCRNNVVPNAPAIVFLIDVSYNNIKSGLVNLLCAEMKSILAHLPVDQGQSRTATKVGFITYSNAVHFYNIKKSLAQPQMMVVGDVHEMFMPLLDGFLCDAQESEAVIDLLMEQIPVMFADTRETETMLLSAIQAGLEALKASACAGKLYVFHSSLPVADGPGKLRNRDDRNALGTDKEKNVLTPQSPAYGAVGEECVQNGVSVDLFVFNNAYIDLATIGQVSRVTGGEVFKYTYFQADIDGHRLVQDLSKSISSLAAFDTVMRVRTSAGVRPTDFYGHFFMSNTTDLEVASIDSNKAIAIEIKHDDKLAAEENVYVQVAVLYTSLSGQRRLRLLNLALKTCTQMSDLFRSCDLDTIVLFLAKQMMSKLLESSPKAIKVDLEARCAQILACYRKNCASPTSAGQLILPDCMKLLPLYASCLMKNDAVSGGSDMTVDDRSYVMQFVAVMNLNMSVSYFYPRMVPIHDVDVDADHIPLAIRTTIEKMADNGAYILENGVHMFVWLGPSLAPEFTQAVFGAPCSQQIDTDRCGVPEYENPLSERVRGIIEQIQSERPRGMRVILVRPRDKFESIFRHFLIEDRGSNGAPSYVDYLRYLHQEIRSLMS